MTGFHNPLALRADPLPGIVVGEGIELIGRYVATIDPGAEGLIAGTRQDDDPYVIVEPDMTPHRRELLLHPLVECVVHLWPVQRDARDVVVHGVDDRTEIVRDDEAVHRLDIATADVAKTGNVSASTREFFTRPAKTARSCVRAPQSDSTPLNNIIFNPARATNPAIESDSEPTREEERPMTEGVPGS